MGMAIFAKGYTKVQTRLVVAQSKLSRELAKQAVTTKCRDNINAELAVPFKKAVDFRAKNKNLWTKRTQTTDGFYRPQISTDLHRLRAKGSDQDDY